MDSNADWLRTNGHVEAVKGLRVCRQHLAAGLVDSYELKWACLAVTTSLQSFIVETFSSVELLGRDPRLSAALTDYEAGERTTAPSATDVRLPPFLGMCEWLRDERGWEPNSSTWTGLENLRQVRDEFMHFKSRGWSIEAALLRDAIRAALDAISYVIDHEPGAFQWYDDALEQAARRELAVAQFLAAERQRS
jgi:hypothetical protein